MVTRVIAIDGPAGSGKSTTARAVAERLGFAHLDSGALYRAVTLAVLDGDVPAAGDAIVGLARSLPVRLALAGRAYRPEVAGVDVSQAIRSTRVTQRVSAVAALPAVREWVNVELRAAAALHPVGVVVDGRDIGSVVFPDAPVKVFLTASPEERARRRSRQAGDESATQETARVQADLERRDQADSTRAVAPLKPAPDAVVLDTTEMGFDEQVERIVRLARKTFP
ncbi:MAG: (d)CMP kinase [Gemmatimonadetes bacterium]|nr:(d)CMP kinase [Gemmatimonadota bacterium]